MRSVAAEERGTGAAMRLAAPIQAPRLPWHILLAVPACAILALAVHRGIATKESATETQTLAIFLVWVLGLSLVAAAIQPIWPGIAPLDAGHVPHSRRRLRFPVRVGSDHVGPASPSAAVFSRPGGGVAEPDQRSRAALRQHVAFARPAARRLYAGREHRGRHGSLHRLVRAGALLGHAGAESRRPDSRRRPGFRWPWSFRLRRSFPRWA